MVRRDAMQIIAGFNRNIVECKDVIHNEHGRRRNDLIETSWNVKIVAQASDIPHVGDLIETSWNVKT